MVEAGHRRQHAGPDLGRVAQLAQLEPRQIGGQVGRQPVGDLAQRRAQVLARVGADEELARRQQRNAVHRAHATLGGGVEGTQRLDLVTEPLDTHGQRLAGRKDVDDPAAPRKLAPAGDLG